MMELIQFIKKAKLTDRNIEGPRRQSGKIYEGVNSI